MPSDLSTSILTCSGHRPGFLSSVRVGSCCCCRVWVLVQSHRRCVGRVKRLSERPPGATLVREERRLPRILSSPEPARRSLYARNLRAHGGDGALRALLVVAQGRAAPGPPAAGPGLACRSRRLPSQARLPRRVVRLRAVPGSTSRGLVSRVRKPARWSPGCGPGP